MKKRKLGYCFLFLMTAHCGPTPSDLNEPAIRPDATAEGLPLSGNLATAKAAGFYCFDNSEGGIRCKKDQVTFHTVKGFSAAVDLAQQPNGRLRFDHLILWNQKDQDAALALEPVLQGSGWKTCLKPSDERYWRPDSNVKILLDVSFWSIRRVIVRSRSSDDQVC